MLIIFKSITNEEEEEDASQDTPMAESANDEFNFETYDDEEGSSRQALHI